MVLLDKEEGEGGGILEMLFSISNIKLIINLILWYYFPDLFWRTVFETESNDAQFERIRNLVDKNYTRNIISASRSC